MYGFHTVSTLLCPRPTGLVVLVLVLFSAGCADLDATRNERLLANAQAAFKTNPKRAIALATRSAELGHVPAMIAMGNYETTGSLKEYLTTGRSELSEEGKSNDWFVRARESAISDSTSGSLSIAAFMFRTGHGGGVDRERSYDLLHASARLGNERILFAAAVWASGDGDVDKAEELRRKAEADGMNVAYHIEAHIAAVRNPDDVIGYATPLARGEENGDEYATHELKRLAYNLSVSAESGEKIAARSIQLLKQNSLWRQPEIGFSPHDAGLGLPGIS